MCTDVVAWCEKVIIPTYEVGLPEKNPIFSENRIYQGSSGVVYPHPVIEKIDDHKIDKEYTAVFIENEFIKIMVLPELGGRIQRAYDKIRNRDFVYYNQVIKPALVGLTGPWISGGIEFNWPQHHRPSTFQPIDYTIEENSDGSKTIWVNEVEKMFRTKGMAGFTLYPDKAYLEIKVRFHNRTSLPQTFLWWANPAVKVNDHAQSVFPPDVHAVFDHGKRDVIDFPIATGTYYKVNYAPGTDISKYKNIPVPTSYMAVQSKYDFIGCYEHDTQAGMLHVADNHISTGKKQWTWGNGDFGQAWDRNLTDDDGPYIEIMCGAYTDNQPDFSWIQPNELKSFEEYFFPYAGIGIVKNATKEAALNLEFIDGEICLKVYATANYKNAKLLFFLNEVLINQLETDLSPSEIYEVKFQPNCEYLPEDILVLIQDNIGNPLVKYQQDVKTDIVIPSPAKAALEPEKIETTELLYLNGLHLEQYRHATFSAEDYYQEALKRDPEDFRNNNAMGLLFLRKGKYELAKPYFRRAIKRSTERNPNPYDGEAYYNLGVCLALQNDTGEAYDLLYKASWNDSLQHSSFLQLARIACKRNDYNGALYLVEKSIIRNYHSHTSRHLKVALLRKLGKLNSAIDLINESVLIDQFNYGCFFEKCLLAKQIGDDAQLNENIVSLKFIIRNNFNNYQEYAIDYIHAGMYEEASDLINLFDSESEQNNPLLYYYKAWIYNKLNNLDRVNHFLNVAADAIPDYCFPNKMEDVFVLEFAIANNPTDSKAHYYLGNYWYSKREYTDAIKCWEQSIAINSNYATVNRNLSLAYFNKIKNSSKSLTFLERAFELNTTDARVLMELDQLYKILQSTHSQRLILLEKHLELVEQRDDLYLERITLYNDLGQYEYAQQLISTRLFHPWEGGEGKVILQFLLCHIELAKAALLEGKYQNALDLLYSTDTYPWNLGEGKLFGTQDNDIFYLKGCAYQGLGQAQKAFDKYTTATVGISEPSQAIFYNDQQPDKIFYQGLAWKKLGNHERAQQLFEKLIEFGSNHINDNIEIDYFAVSLPDLLVFEQDLNVKNTIHCNYLIGLGLLGMEQISEAKHSFNKVLEKDMNHQGAAIHLGMIGFLLKQNQPI